ncbi:response regulator [bacterium]|nr:response regulator [bacterium]
MSGKSILIVEDEDDIVRLLKSILISLGHEVSAVCSSGEDAVRIAQEKTPDLALMDISLVGEMDGIETAREIYSRFKIPIVFLTGYADSETMERAKIAEPFGYIVKPFDISHLKGTLEMAIRKGRIEKELKENQEWLQRILKNVTDAVIVTDSKGILKLMNFAAESITGLEEKETAGKPLADILTVMNGLTDKEFINPVTRVISKDAGSTFSNLLVFNNKDCKEICIEGTGTPIRDRNGEITDIILVFRDINESKKKQDALFLSNSSCPA